MADQIGVGIIGANPDRGWAVSAHIPALKSLPRYALRAVSTTRKETADATAQRFGVPLAFDDHHALVTHPAVDLVVVSVKVPLHHALVTSALRAGKHVFCEWPLGNGLDEALSLRDLAVEKGVQHVVGLQARASLVINQVRDLVAQGYVGEVLSVSVLGSGSAWGPIVDTANAYLYDRANGATLLSIPGGHFMDALCYALGELGEIGASFATRRTRVTLADTGETRPVTSPDQVLVSGTLPNGAPVSLHLRGGQTNGTNLHWEINGTEGTLLVTGPSAHVQLADLKLLGARGDAPLAELPASNADTHAHRHAPAAPPGPAFNVAQLYALLADDIAHGTRKAPSFDTAVTRHRMLAAIERAAATGNRERYAPAP
ncbi:putative oxidoreductase [Chondromyces apiculatus DSM 436]|uniref:Putative oxidoreductase n=2 Tax=Chondromyces apiculatus TaxID=51 RepID=A0A017TGV4_9BACT|nr:putative oxidoreductase [Chondromyces apiculatus DSM 436]